MTRETGAYDIVSGLYKGVTLEAPREFWTGFSETKLRAAGFG